MRMGLAARLSTHSKFPQVTLEFTRFDDLWITMSYDEGLAERIRVILRDDHRVTEREMFGGIAFMLDGNMICGVIDDSLMARIGPDAYEDALEERHVRPMDFTGQPMRGMVFVDPPGLASGEALEGWIHRSMAYARSLPAK